MLPAIICVELIGIPKKLAPKMIAEAESSAVNPCAGSSLVREKAIVLIIRKPPEAVPSPIITAHAMMTQRGM